MKKGLMVAATAMVLPISAATVALNQKTDVKVESIVETVDVNSRTFIGPINENEELYLAEEAKSKVDYPEDFVQQVRYLANGLGVPPEWLMAVMHSESGFSSSTTNKKGSGAKGLIQWMPSTLKDLGVETLPKSAYKQLIIVEDYLFSMRKRVGNFNSFTDLKLAILYPRAVGKAKDYILFSYPSKAYYQNEGLDKDSDGLVTVEDIEQKMKESYNSAYSFSAS